MDDSDVIYRWSVYSDEGCTNLKRLDGVLNPIDNFSGVCRTYPDCWQNISIRCEVPNTQDPDNLKAFCVEYYESCDCEDRSDQPSSIEGREFVREPFPVVTIDFDECAPDPHNMLWWNFPPNYVLANESKQWFYLTAIRPPSAQSSAPVVVNESTTHDYKEDPVDDASVSGSGSGPPSPLIIVLAVVIPLCVVGAVIVIAVLIMRRWKRNNNKGTATTRAVEETSPAPQSVNELNTTTANAPSARGGGETRKINKTEHHHVDADDNTDVDDDDEDETSAAPPTWIQEAEAARAHRLDAMRYDAVPAEVAYSDL